jgi:hypothetical protein
MTEFMPELMRLSGIIPPNAGRTRLKEGKSQ